MHLIKSLGVAAFVTLVSAHSAEAGLLDILRDNGTISVEQYDTLQAEAASRQKKAGELKIVGRLYADFAHYQDDKTALSSGAELRTARLEAKGKYGEHWRYKAQFALDNDAVSSRYIWLGYQFDNGLLKIGRSAEANGLEDYTSSRYITFMERALPVTAFAGNFAQGIEYNGWRDNSSLQVSALLDDGKPASNPAADEKFKLNLRYSIAPLLSSEQTIHLGLHAHYLSPPAKTARVRSRPESHVTNTRLLDTGTLANIDSIRTSGLEFAWVGGPASVQAEYLSRELTQAGGTDLRVDGYYIYGSYSLSGHTRNYDARSGAFARPRLNGRPMLEVALRYSSLDLREANAGQGNNITFGVSWWPRSNIRFSFNQVLAEFDDAGSASDERYGISQLRAQIDF